MNDDVVVLTPLDEAWLGAVEIEFDLIRCDGDSSGLLQLLDSTDGEVGYTDVSYESSVNESLHRFPRRTVVEGESPVNDLLLAVLLSRERDGPVHEIQVEVVEFEILESLSKLNLDLLGSVERVPELLDFVQHLPTTRNDASHASKRRY